MKSLLSAAIAALVFNSNAMMRPEINNDQIDQFLTLREKRGQIFDILETKRITLNNEYYAQGACAEPDWTEFYKLKGDYDAYLEVWQKHCAERDRQVSPIKEAVFFEICDASRIPTAKETSSVCKLISVLDSCGMKIDQVRYMDAASLIGSMQFPNAVTQYLLSLLDTQSEELACSFVYDFLSRSHFSDDCFKEKILSDILDGCRKNKIYRDLFITLIARKMSLPLISAKIDFFKEALNEPMRFENESYGSSRYNTIQMSYDMKECLFSSLFATFDTQKKESSNFFKFPLSKQLILFHEAGHSVSSHFAASSTDMGDMDYTMEIAAHFASSKINKHAMEDRCRVLKSASPKFQDEFIKSCEYLEHSCHNHKDIATFIAFAMEQFSSPKKVAAALFGKPLEVFQILGVALLKHNEKNVLLINSLSDFALYAEMGIPIRASHVVGMESDDMDPSLWNECMLMQNCSNEAMVTHYMNFELYGALLATHGTSMQQYVMKLSFGENLAEYLKREYVLWKDSALRSLNVVELRSGLRKRLFLFAFKKYLAIPPVSRIAI
jgi:hypothetical protein